MLDKLSLTRTADSIANMYGNQKATIPWLSLPMQLFLLLPLIAHIRCIEALNLLGKNRLHRERRASGISPKKLFFRSDPTATPSGVFGSGLIQTLDGTSRFVKIPQSRVRYRITDRPISQQPTMQDGWRSSVHAISSAASLLCVLDCTLLPLFAIIFPVFNLAIPSALFHHIAHAVAIYFVLPMGLLTTALNYASHRRIRLLSFSLVGLILIGLTNSHIFNLDALHHGWGHRFANIAGCTVLLVSNYLSRQLSGHVNCDC